MLQVRLICPRLHLETKNIQDYESCNAMYKLSHKINSPMYLPLCALRNELFLALFPEETRLSSATSTFTSQFTLLLGVLFDGTFTLSDFV